MKRARPFLVSGAMTAVIMTAISFFISDPSQSKSTLVAGIIAGITIVTIPVYDIPRWSLAKRSLLHFGIMLVTVLPLLLWSGWFPPLIAVGIFVLFGLVGWSLGYLVHRAQSKRSSTEPQA